MLVDVELVCVYELIILSLVIVFLSTFVDCYVRRQIGAYSSQRAYILRRELADLEVALIQYTLKYLNDHVN